MEDFAERHDPHVSERLLDVLDRQRPFRRFKDALQAFPAVRDAWFAFEEEKLRQAARQWIEYQEIDAEFFVPGPPPTP